MNPLKQIDELIAEYADWRGKTLAKAREIAREWRDACLLYFQQFSKRPLPGGVEPPEHTLDYYEAVQLHYVPGTPSGK